ncbi:MAG TPA: UTP--glucose-1-phosphate uridylyltransferase, partial [bacterium]|nr:UTP--glucose-1-phosphate uridylyltransferase [bacterium]
GRMIENSGKRPIAFENYPHWMQWLSYRMASQEIDTGSLFQEIAQLEKAVQLALIENKDEKRFLELYENFKLLGKLLHLELTRDEYNQIRLNRERIKPSYLAGELSSLVKGRSENRLGSFFEKILKKRSQDGKIPNPFASFFKEAFHFYEKARTRDRMLVENALKTFANTKNAGALRPQILVLIAGGFHTEGLTRHLTDRRIPHAVIVPRMTRLEENDLYDNVMRGKNADVSRYLKEILLTKQEALFFKEAIEQVFTQLYGTYHLSKQQLTERMKILLETHPVFQRSFRPWILEGDEGPSVGLTIREEMISPIGSFRRPGTHAVPEQLLTSNAGVYRNLQIPFLRSGPEFSSPRKASYHLTFQSGGRAEIDIFYSDRNQPKLTDGSKRLGFSYRSELRHSDETVELNNLIERQKIKYAEIAGEDKREAGYALSLKRLGKPSGNVLNLLNDPVLQEQEAKEIVAKALAFGKGGIFHFWQELTEAEKRNLIDQLKTINFEEIESLYQRFIVRKEQGAKVEITAEQVKAPPVDDITQVEMESNIKARQEGEEAFRKGQVAILELAGGSGSRFGGLKIRFGASPVMNWPLAKMRAQKIRALSEEYGQPVPWLIMTSDVTHDKTLSYFKSELQDGLYFGYIPQEWVRFKRQTVMPQVTSHGEFILEAKNKIVVGGFGHGDARDWVLRDSEIQEWLKNFGIEYITMVNLDNAFLPGAIEIGYHILSGNEIKPGVEHLSILVVEKTNPAEKVGLAVLLNNKDGMIEYNQIPAELLY